MLKPVILIVNYGLPEADDWKFVPAWLADGERNLVAFLYEGRAHLSEADAVQEYRLYIEAGATITLGHTDRVEDALEYIQKLQAISAWEFVATDLLREYQSNFEYDFVTPPGEEAL